MNTTSIHRALAGAACGALLLTGCSADAEDAPTRSADPGTEGTSYPVTIDDCGESTTFDAAPERVLTIGTAAISLLDTAGASDRITVRSGEFGAPLPDSLSHPPEDAEIVDPSDPAAESIIGSGADAVYGYGLFNATPEQLEQAGIPLLTVLGECGHDATTDSGEVGFTTISDDVRRLGVLFDTSDVAESAADELDERVATLTADAATDGDAAWLYFFSSTDSLSGYGGTGMPAAVLETAGLENVFGDEEEPYLTIDMESLLAADPEWLVLSYGLYGESAEEAREQLLAEKGASELTAVKEDRLVLVPGSGSEPSPRAVDGLAEIVKAVGGR